MSDTDVTAALNRAVIAQQAYDAQSAILAAEKVKLDEAMSALEIVMDSEHMISVGSTMGSALFTPKMVYTPTDWTKVYAFIRESGDFSILHKRLSLTALRDRHSNEELPPGIEPKMLRELKVTPR